MNISERERQRRDHQRAMSIAEFCRSYNTGRTTAYHEIKSGRLRAVKCGKRTPVTEDDAEAWLRSLPTVADAGGVAMSLAANVVDPHAAGHPRAARGAVT